MNLIILSHNALLTDRIDAGQAEHCPFTKIIGHCYTVEAGFEAVGVLKPDVVLLDLDMPKAKKLGILATLTADGFQVIALTTNDALFRKSQKQGIVIIMSEPLDMPALAALINAI